MTVVLAGLALLILVGLVASVSVVRGGNEAVVITGRVYIVVLAREPDWHTGSLLPSDAPVSCMLKYHVPLYREQPFGAPW